MSNYQELPQGVAPARLGVEWVNIITGHDHTSGNANGPYFCEIHLQINLAGEEVFNELNGVLTRVVQTGAPLESKLLDVKRILKQELARANRINESTTAIVEAIRLR